MLVMFLRDKKSCRVNLCFGTYNCTSEHVPTVTSILAHGHGHAWERLPRVPSHQASRNVQVTTTFGLQIGKKSIVQSADYFHHKRPRKIVMMLFAQRWCKLLRANLTRRCVQKYRILKVRVVVCCDAFSVSGDSCNVSI